MSQMKKSIVSTRASKKDSNKNHLFVGQNQRTYRQKNLETESPTNENTVSRDIPPMQTPLEKPEQM